MEKLTAGKSRGAVLSAVKSLLPVLLEHLGDEKAFCVTAKDTLMFQLKGLPAMSADAEALSHQIYVAVLQIRGMQTRHITDHQALLLTQKKLEPKFANFPVRQGCLWLAVRARQEALNRLDSAEGKTALTKLVDGLDQDRNLVAKNIHEMEYESLESLEAGLARIASAILGKGRHPFLLITLAGEIVEASRKLARRHPVEAALPADFSDNSPRTRVLSALEETVRGAELAEARQRFTLLNDHQKATRYDALRKVMQARVAHIAPAAVLGYDSFCQAVEAVAFPYPAPMEWVRIFLKPLYTNAQQSTLFDKCRTEKSVVYRHQKILEERGVNPLMLELARAFALATIKTVQQESLKNFLLEVNLIGEFNWPSDLEELMEQMKA